MFSPALSFWDIVFMGSRAPAVPSGTNLVTDALDDFVTDAADPFITD